MSRGKKYKASIAQFDRQHLYTPVEAVDLVKASAKASFDETVEVAVRLGVDPRKADQIVRGTLSLPAGTGRTARVAVFAAGEKAAEARAAGADVVGADDLVARVANEGFLDFDVAIATPDLMGQVGTLGRVLGPRGLMPNPKTGTVTDDVERAVAEFKGGRVEYRTDKVGNIHLRVGQGVLRPGQAAREPACGDGGDPPGQAGLLQGPLRPGGHPVLDHGPRGPHRSAAGPQGRRGAGRQRLSGRRAGRYRLVRAGRSALESSRFHTSLNCRRPPVHR